MDLKAISKKTHEFAQSPENCAALLKDPKALPGLLVLLDNEDPEVVELTVDTLRLLSELEANRPLMRKVELMGSIKKLLESRTSTPAAKSSAKKIVNNLRHDVQPGATKAADKKPGPPATPTRSFFKLGNRAQRVLTLHVAGVAIAENQQLVKDALLRVKGLVSFTFNTREEYVVVHALDTVAPAEFAAVIAATGTLKAQQVVKDDDGADVFVDLNDDKEADAKKTDADGYLDDDDDTPYEKELSNKALARVNDGGRGGGGWLGSVGNFIATKLYW